jgi:predicted nucleic acid-binding protein
VIYLDSSVALAHLLGEHRPPPEWLWDEPLLSSRLLEYEVWNRINSRGLAASCAAAVQALIDRVTLLELSPPILARALQPFPVQVRTLDALHIATLAFVQPQVQTVSLATYHDRLLAAAQALGMTTAAI